MKLRLTAEQADRLDVLRKGIRTFATGSKPLCYNNNMNKKRKVLIKPAQVLKIKEMLKAGDTHSTITMVTGCGEYQITGVKNGRYDFLLGSGEK